MDTRTTLLFELNVLWWKHLVIVADHIEIATSWLGRLWNEGE